MTSNPNHDMAIVDLVRRIQLARGESVKVEWTEKFIKNLGYGDPGRELRRLKQKGLLNAENGKYFTTRTQRPNSLERWV